MQLTLNQVISRIRTLALSHSQINSFYFGEVPEFNTGNLDYPACFLEQQPGSISRTERQQRFNFRVYLVDLVKVSDDTEGNETEVLSDMSGVAADLMAMMFSFEYAADWMIVEVAPVVPVTESLEDMVAGVVMEVGVLVDFLADRCKVPSTDVTFEEDFDMARTRLLPYEGTGLEGDSFTVTGLAGKNVIAAFRATDYKRVITTVPTDTDRIMVTGIDLGTYKGVLSSTGNVALSSGDALMLGEILDFLIYE